MERTLPATTWPTAFPRLRPHPTATVLLVLLVTPHILQGNYADFASYFAGVRRAFSEGSPYSAWQLAQPYILPAAAGGHGFVYPPTAIPFLGPFAITEQMGLAFDYLGILALWEVVWRLTGVRTMLRALALAVFVGLNDLVVGSLNVAQVTPWIAAGFGLMYLAPRASGYVAAVVGMVKLLPGVGIVWTLRKRQPLLGPVLFTAAVTVGVAVWMGPSVYLDYLGVLGNSEPGCRAVIPSFACAGVPWAGYAAAVALAGLALLIPSDEAALAMLGWATVVAAPDPYPHYLLVPLVASIPLVRRLASSRRPVDAMAAPTS